MTGETRIMNWGRREPVSCSCGDVSLFCASLIPQPWMQSRDHVLSTLCRCGKCYFNFGDGKEYAAKEPRP